MSGGATASLFGDPLPANALRQPLDLELSKVGGAWAPILKAWRESADGQRVSRWVDSRVAQGCTVYPAEIFRAFVLTPLERVRVVILGQDPYHGPGQAHGLAFSVPEGVKTPPSLRNILAELQRDLGRAPAGTDLSEWAREGVLLLNTTLTVEAGAPASHSKKGWESLALHVLQAVVARGLPCVYMLWGAHAQQFAPVLVARPGAAAPLVLCANHPSPLSARRPPVPFLGCGHFSSSQKYWRDLGGEIHWIT